MNILNIVSSQSYSNIVATIAMVVAFVAVPASAYFSYKYAIKGEKRKEWNAIAEPLLEHYEQVSDEAKRGQTYSTTSIPIEQFDKIKRRMTHAQREGFLRLAEQVILLRNSTPTKERNVSLHLVAVEICELIKLK